MNDMKHDTKYDMLQFRITQREKEQFTKYAQELYEGNVSLALRMAIRVAINEWRQGRSLCVPQYELESETPAVNEQR